jgi:hypothetical protein
MCWGTNLASVNFGTLRMSVLILRSRVPLPFLPVPAATTVEPEIFGELRSNCPVLNMKLPMHRMKYVRQRESEVALTRIHSKRLRLPKRARNKKPKHQNSKTHRLSF